ncbi:MAG: hypothetical protein AAFV53_02080 [Myxococcota bacterium]
MRYMVLIQSNESPAAINGRKHRAGALRGSDAANATPEQRVAALVARAYDRPPHTVMVDDRLYTPKPLHLVKIEGDALARDMERNAPEGFTVTLIPESTYQKRSRIFRRAAGIMITIGLILILLGTIGVAIGPTGGTQLLLFLAGFIGLVLMLNSVSRLLVLAQARADWFDRLRCVYSVADLTEGAASASLSEYTAQMEGLLNRASGHLAALAQRLSEEGDVAVGLRDRISQLTAELGALRPQLHATLAVLEEHNAQRQERAWADQALGGAALSEEDDTSNDAQTLRALLQQVQSISMSAARMRQQLSVPQPSLPDLQSEIEDDFDALAQARREVARLQRIR